MLTILALLRAAAERRPVADALLALGRPPLHHAELVQRIERVQRVLAALGIQPGEPVAVVMPNGAEMAVVCLALATGAACCPLNPDARRDEFAFAFDDLQPRALFTVPGLAGEARSLAVARGMPVVDVLSAPDQPAGAIELQWRAPPGGVNTSPVRPAGPHDVALILHTSGTTARPKTVPLTHANIVATAANLTRAMALTADDICLNVMPMFHVGSLVDLLVPPLAAGGAVVCGGTFDAARLPALIATFGPTWLQLVPAMAHELLAHHRERPAALLGPRTLRVVRAVAAAVPPALIADFEGTFGVPLLEVYGMTETATLIATNPLPPAPRKPGSVGRPAGPEVAILGDDGRLLSSPQRGEVVVRGSSVMRGYLGDAAANAHSFVDGWFRTGDLGWLDADGDLFLVGRVKEIVNRGGEKVSPAEVDEVLRQHPGVVEAGAFAVPHASLGEDVAAAVVRAPGSAVDERQLIDFVAARLAWFKVPRRVCFVDALPRTSTGKLRRAELALRCEPELRLRERATATLPAAQAAALPTSPLGRVLGAMWARVLEIEAVGAGDHFFDLGGDSLRAAVFVNELQQITGEPILVSAVFDAPTLSEFEAMIVREHPAAERRLLQVAGDSAPGSATSPAPGADATGAVAAAPVVARDFALTAAQRRLWSMGGEGGSVHTVPFVFRCSGVFPLAALTGALTTIQARHVILRTAIVEHEGAPRAVVRDDCPLPIRVFDLDAGADEHAAGIVDELLGAPFALERAPLWRVGVVRLGAERTLLAFAMHHLVFDGWSKDLLLGELAVASSALAAGQQPELPALPWQYADFATWQNERQGGAELERQRAHWRQALAGVNEALRLPVDHPAVADTPRDGANFHAVVPANLVEQAASLAARADAGPFACYAAAFHLLLHRHTGQNDQVVCLPVAGRSRAELQPMIGFCNGLVLLRVDLGGDPTLREVVQRARRAGVLAQDHADVPLHEQAELAGITHLPLRSAMFSYRHAREAALRLPDVDCEPVDLLRQAADFDLEFHVRREGDRTVLVLRYAEAVFDRSTVARLAERYLEVLAVLIAEPDRRVSTLPSWVGATPRLPTSAAIRGARNPGDATRGEPRHALDRELAGIWRSVLRIGREVGIDEPFVELGGTSLQLIVLIERIERQLGRRLSLASLGRVRTVRELADAIGRDASPRDAATWQSIDARLARAGLAIDIYRALLVHTAAWPGRRRCEGSLLFGRNLEGSERPLFWCMQSAEEFDAIATHIGPTQPLWAMRSGHLVMAKTDANVAALARFYADEIVRIDPVGPYALFGTCQSADIALGVASELRGAGRVVELLGLQEKFVAQPYDGRVALFFGERSRRNPFRYVPDPERAWRRFYSGPIEAHQTPGKHTRMFREPHVSVLAARVREALARARAAAPVTILREAPAPLPAGACRALVEIPRSVRGRPGERVRLTISVTNAGSGTWGGDDASAVRIGHRWHGHERNSVLDADLACALSTPLSPGQSATVSLEVTLPRASGRYRLEVEPIDAASTWFSAHGSPPAAADVRVSRLFLPGRWSRRSSTST